MPQKRKPLKKDLLTLKKMAAMERLSGRVGHAFNNHVMAILGFANLIQKNVNLDDQVYRDVQEIIKAAQRCALLTRQLLARGRRRV